MRYCAWFVSWYSSISRCVNTSCQRSRTSSKRSSRSTVRTSRSSKSIAFDWCSRRSYSSKTSATVCSKKPPTCSLNSAAETRRFFSAEMREWMPRGGNRFGSRSSSSRHERTSRTWSAWS